MTINQPFFKTLAAESICAGENVLDFEQRLENCGATCDEREYAFKAFEHQATAASQ